MSVVNFPVCRSIEDRCWYGRRGGPTAARTRVKTGIWYFRQCQTAIRLWHDQHPRFQFER
jgi:hypothetical protein